MSFKQFATKKNTAIAVLAVAAAATAGLTASGAWDSVTGTSTASVTTDSLSQAHTASIGFANLAPGAAHASTQDYQVTNQSKTIDANVLIGDNVKLLSATGVSGLTAAQLSEIDVSVSGSNGYYLAPTSIATLASGGSALNWGVVKAGQTVDYKITLSEVGSATDLNINAAVTVQFDETLAQVQE